MMSYEYPDSWIEFNDETGMMELKVIVTAQSIAPSVLHTWDPSGPQWRKFTNSIEGAEESAYQSLSLRLNEERQNV